MSEDGLRVHVRGRGTKDGKTVTAVVCGLPARRASQIRKRARLRARAEVRLYFAFPGFGGGFAAAAAIPATVAESGTAATVRSSTRRRFVQRHDVRAGIVNVWPPGPGTWVAVVPVETAMSPEI